MSKFETIKDFLNSEKNPGEYEYDLTLDCVGEDVRSLQYEIKNCVDRFFTYHDSRSLKIDVKDPDGNSDLLQKVYRCLWACKLLDSESMKNEYRKLGDNKFATYSDCMTSAYASVRLLMNTLYDRKGKGWHDLCKTYFDNSHTFIQDLERNNFNHAVDFMHLYHTIGNYCPVPWGFNCERCGGFGKEKWVDYWDLTLMKIRKYYLSGNDERVIAELYQIDEANEKTRCCKQWLDSLGEGETGWKGKTGWKNFIEKNFFQDYVYDFDDKCPEVPSENKLEVKPFFEGHLWDNPDVPADKLEEFFVNISSLIRSRGERMFDELLKRDKA